MSAKPWEIDGQERRKTAAGLEDALRRIYEGRRGPALDSDRPPPSTFPMTRAARAALRYSTLGSQR